MKAKDINKHSDLVNALNFAKPESAYHVGMKIEVDNKMQSNYTYRLEESIGMNFDSLFTPHLSPRQMLELGVFEGKYCNDQIFEFPKEWYETAIRNRKLSPEKPIAALNYFKQKSRNSLKIWKDNGWIYGDDSRGWFEWYMRYYLGRRDPNVDRKQIMRWRGIKRHVGGLQKACNKGDVSCRPRHRQTLLQWAYDGRIL